MIKEYIESKKFAWSPSTLRSESYRLGGIAAHLNGNPETLWTAIQDLKPYARLTLWTRVCDYWQFLIDNNQERTNPYAKFRKENARLFKNAYVRSKPSIGYQEARNLIQSIASTEYREHATRILESGLRFGESNSVDQDGNVRGKGGKTRAAFARSTGTAVSYHGFRRALQKIGLKPHDLRKLFLSRLVELGANEFELCEIAGWSNINTASSYIKVNTSRLSDLVKRARE